MAASGANQRTRCKTAFFPSLTRHITAIGRATIILFVLSMIPITWIMGSDIIRLLTD